MVSLWDYRQGSYTLLALNNIVGEKELLGIVEGLKAFDGVIPIQDLTVHTDPLNLLYNKLPRQRSRHSIISQYQGW